MADGRETPRLFPGILDAFTADVTKILTRTEMQAVLAELRRKAPRSKNTRLNLVIFRLSDCCGLRASETAQLQMADVRVELPRPHIRIRVGRPKADGRDGCRCGGTAGR